MATVILDTGILDSKLNVGQAEGTRTSLPLETQIYPSNANEQSLISVQPGMMMVVTGYGALVGGAEDNPIANIYKVLLAEPVTTRTLNACHLEVQRSEVSILAEARICDMTLTQCDPMVVIDVPGVYSVRVLDEDLTVTAMSHPIKTKA